MESSRTVQGVSFKQDLRDGQREVFNELETCGPYLNVQLPTGYGKTFTAAGCYAIKQRTASLNRLLVIFPTDAQLLQFEKDSKPDRSDLHLAGVEGPRHVVDVRFFGSEAIRQHRNNTAQVFAITVQSLIQARGDDNVRSLMQTGRWMVVVDEYHHYGIEKAWGKSVRTLPASFLLAMSATPTRPDDDSAFGKPHVIVSYRDAVQEGAVKPLIGHAYHYRIDAVDHDGVIHSYTTSELADVAGDSPDAVEKWRIERKMRWSPKYVSPLVHEPMERILYERQWKAQPVQALFAAMCVSHAEMVCEQIRSLYPEMRVDWVGTGINGRTDVKNKEIIESFCPPKDEDGRRSPTLDVLVHVGMAGEGLDCTLVTEVVHLNEAGRNNSNNQENGRASRILKDANGKRIDIEGHINFDATSDYVRFVGEAIMDAMDGLDHPKPGTPREPSEPEEYKPAPDEPIISIYDMELEYIDSGDPGVQRMARVAHEARVPGFDIRIFKNASNPGYDAAVDFITNAYRAMRRREDEASNCRSVVMQHNDAVNLFLSRLVGFVIHKMTKSGQRHERSLSGDIKKRINARKKLEVGEIARDVGILKAHYAWLKKLETEIRQKGLPSWLL